MSNMAKQLENLIEVLYSLKDETIYSKEIEIPKESLANNLLLDNRYCPNCYPYAKE